MAISETSALTAPVAREGLKTREWQNEVKVADGISEAIRRLRSSETKLKHHNMSSN